MSLIKTDGKLRWHFKPQPKGYPEKEDTGEEFFSNADIVNEVATLVRESTQNSLDERHNESKPIVMRFFVGQQVPEMNLKYFKDLFSHIAHSKIRKAPSIDKKSKYLLIEDFNTLGMEGSLSSEAIDLELEKTERQAMKNPKNYKESFYYFEWKTGESGKGNGKRGSWGVGKVVFPRASRIKSYLVYSVRQKHASPDGPTSLLFGHCILNYRHVLGERFIPDCQWMESGDDGVSYPSGNSTLQSEFIADWKLTRKLGEMGTSIVIPFCRDSLTVGHLTQSIIRDYFINILDGVLECKIENSEGDSIVLNSKTLVEEIKKLPEDYSTKVAKTKSELLELCFMYQKFINSETVKVELESTVGAPNDWSLIRLEDNIKNLIETSLASGKTLEVRVPVFVPATEEFTENWDSLTVLLQKTSTISASTVFCRDGILIPNANRDSKLQEILSLVLIGSVRDADQEKDNSIANLLKWSEGPSHESWNVTATKFKDRYISEDDGKQAIRWVKNSAEKVVDLTRNLDDEQDDKSLSEYAQDNESGVGPTTVGTHPSVFLTLDKGVEPFSVGELKWEVKNFDPGTVSIQEISDVPTVLFEGLREKSFKLGQYDLKTKIEFFVEVSDSSTVIRSNSVWLVPQVVKNQKVLVDKERGGFTVSSVIPVSEGCKVVIQAAYASRTNNSIKNWSVEDFELSAKLDRRSLAGLKFVGFIENSAMFESSQPHFKVRFKDFDPLRDLLVSTSVQEIS